MSSYMFNKYHIVCAITRSKIPSTNTDCSLYNKISLIIIIMYAGNCMPCLCCTSYLIILTIIFFKKKKNY